MDSDPGDAIATADQLIGHGEFDIVVAGGMESMTNGPHLLAGARAGYRFGEEVAVYFADRPGSFPSSLDRTALTLGPAPIGFCPRRRDDSDVLGGAHGARRAA